MATSIIKDPNQNQNQNQNQNPNPKLEFPLKSHTNNTHSHSHSHSPSFLLHNGFNSSDLPNSDIEMITIQAVTYTSLKDLLPASSSSPPTGMSPTMMMMINSSWYDEIPIKNPLVKHAALAYLQPMSTRPEVRNKGIFGKLKENCTCATAGFFSCFAWINDVVVSTFKDAFSERRASLEFDEDDDEDDEEDEKVD